MAGHPYRMPAPMPRREPARKPRRSPAPRPSRPPPRDWVVPLARDTSLLLGVAGIPAAPVAVVAGCVEVCAGTVGPALVFGIPGLLVAASLLRVSPLHPKHFIAANATAMAAIVLNLFLLCVTLFMTFRADSIEWAFLYSLRSPVGVFTAVYIVFSLGQAFLLIEAVKRLQRAG